MRIRDDSGRSLMSRSAVSGEHLTIQTILSPFQDVDVRVAVALDLRQHTVDTLRAAVGRRQRQVANRPSDRPTWPSGRSPQMGLIIELKSVHPGAILEMHRGHLPGGALETTTASNDGPNQHAVGHKGTVSVRIEPDPFKKNLVLILAGKGKNP